jgi:hypothetical protein
VPRSKNAWNYISTPHYAFTVWCLVKHRDNFIFYTMLILLWEGLSRKKMGRTPVARSSYRVELQKTRRSKVMNRREHNTCRSAWNEPHFGHDSSHTSLTCTSMTSIRTNSSLHDAGLHWAAHSHSFTRSRN